MAKLTVTASSGKTVNLRKEANSSSAILEAVPIGAQVDLIAKTSSTWYQVKYNKKEGYMMAKYLTDNTPITKTDIQKIYNSLSEALKLIEGIMK